MARRRNRLNWIYDNDLQQFTTPTGQTITLQSIAQMLQDQIESRHDLAGPWMGWRIRQNRLIPPGEIYRTSQITPNNLRAFTRWLRSFEGEQAQLEFDKATADHRESARGPNDHASADKQTHGHNEHLPQYQPAKEDPSQEKEATYQARTRAQVIQLAEYRKKARRPG